MIKLSLVYIVVQHTEARSKQNTLIKHKMGRVGFGRIQESYANKICS